MQQSAPRSSLRLRLATSVSFLVSLSPTAWAQTVSPGASIYGPSTCIVVPQSRAFVFDPNGALQITEVEADVVILEQAATTTLDISLRNPTSTRREAELLVPVPDGAVVRGFSFQGSSAAPTAKLLPRAEAKKIYDEIVARAKDPAILELAGYNVVRSSVFPVEAGGTQKLRLTYEHLIDADQNRLDYVIPRSESVGYQTPWKVSVRIESKSPISTVYSPSHKLEVTRTSANVVNVRLAGDVSREPGHFRLSYLVQRDALTASMIAYPDASIGGGYFLLLAGLPAKPLDGSEGTAMKREVTLVIDRSGSMAGEKFEQARQAAIQILNSLESGESFNLVVYSDTVELFSPEPVVKTPESIERATAYVKSLRTASGTNIHDALLEALRQKPAPGTLPLVLFLTDGLPTVGQTSEKAIREVATKLNPHNRRIFSFGVGFDVNTPLLENIASDTRGSATFVLPNENVEVKVAQAFRKLQGPILAEPQIACVDSSLTAVASSRVRELMPSKLPDLFDGDQLVLFGQYRGSEPIGFVVKGNYLGKNREFTFHFGLEKASTRNAFVPRLWASRKIAFLVDAIRQLGADPSPTTLASASDPRMKELVDEIVRLSTEFGILTEYTAFLAHEGTDLTKKDAVFAEACGNLSSRAYAVRSGIGSVNQELNVGAQKAQACLNFGNSYVDENLNRVAITTVQQINDCAFYRKGNRWVDSRALRGNTQPDPKKTIEFASEEFRALASKLADEGRGGCISLKGDILLVVDGEPVLVKSPVQSVK